jgi:hypothetical protein
MSSVLNLRTSRIRLRECPIGRERQWIIGRLLAKRGVLYADYPDGAARELVVAYDADVLSGAELLDFLDGCGLSASPAATLRVA